MVSYTRVAAGYAVVTALLLALLAIVAPHQTQPSEPCAASSC